MRIRILFFLLIFSNVVHAQKPTINFDTYRHWPQVSGGQLNADGGYAMYYVKNIRAGQTSLFVRATRSLWQLEIQNCLGATFNGSGDKLIGQIPNDTAIVLDLKLRTLRKIPNVSDCKIFPLGNEDYLFLKSAKDESLIIQSVNRLSNISFKNRCIDYKVSERGSNILMRQKENDSDQEFLTYYDFNNTQQEIVYNGGKISSITYDETGNKAVFIVDDKLQYSIWYFAKGLKKAQKIFDNSDNQIVGKYKISYENVRFSGNGSQIFFYLQSITNQKYLANEQPEIWSYKDAYLRSFYNDLNGRSNITQSSLVQLDLASNHLTQITKGGERLVKMGTSNESDSLFIVESSFGREDEQFIPSSKISYTLRNINSGTNIIFEGNLPASLSQISISPKGNLVCYYNPMNRAYMVFNVKSHKLINISEKISDKIQRCDTALFIKAELHPPGLIGWLENEDGVVIAGEYDIWCLDPGGKFDPINLTSNIGFKEKTVFNLASKRDASILKWGAYVILTSFNLKTKDLGFCKMKISKFPFVSRLSSGANYTTYLENKYFELSPNDYITSEDGNSYLVLKQTFNNAPNYFYSDDLKKFSELSNIQPQIGYNWVKAEIYKYKDRGGKLSTGIIYKPENFDPKQKYPVLFNYYTELSNTLNSFPSVELPPANFSIAMAVSNGYIVCLPDMNIPTGDAGDGALRSINAAVEYLSSFPWIDLEKMGISGHSFGGFETNYIVTHSNLFKAAVSAAGVSDFISMAYDIWGSSGLSKQSYYQYSVPRMGRSLVEDPETYIKNSAILNCSSITTPLLLVHNNNDKSVPVRQSMQFFIALRSLNKPVWWLNYKNETHAIGREQNRLDYNKRVMSFFDHYLKGKQEPAWMSEHI